MPLVGKHAGDPRLFGVYVRSALYLRKHVLVVLLVPGSLLFLVLSAGHGWSVPLRLSLLATVLVAVVARASSDLYALPMLMNNRFRDYYGVQFVTNAIRLGSAALLRFLGILSGVSASALNALAMVGVGWGYKRLAQTHLDPSAVRDAASTRKIVNVAKPLIPGIIFAAGQGQLTVFLASIFGSTTEIAQLGALGRLGTLFTVLGGLTIVLISPRFPQLDRARLPSEIRGAIGLSCAAGLGLSAVAFVEPSWFLVVLGPSYAELTSEVGWFIAGASVTFIGTVAYSINVARRFIWLRGTLGAIAIILATQLVCLATLDLGNVLDLQYFALATAVAALLPQAVMMRIGLQRGPRTLEGEGPTSLVVP